MSELKESKEQFCFVRDDSAHWYLLPLRFKEDFNKFKEEENEEMMEKFSGYLLGSIITICINRSIAHERNKKKLRRKPCNRNKYYKNEFILSKK